MKRASLLCWVVLAACSGPEPMTLHDLTPPPGNLPDGCELQSASQIRGGNPAVSTDPEIVGYIGLVLAGPSEDEEGEEFEVLQARRAAEAVEGYAAFYRSSSSSRTVNVWALRFRDPISPDRASRLDHHPTFSGTSIHDERIAVLISPSGPEDGCFESLREHAEDVLGG